MTKKEEEEGPGDLQTATQSMLHRYQSRVNCNTKGV